MSVIKCAVYVRKSTEHGLEQAFNQEPFCKAYISLQTLNIKKLTVTVALPAVIHIHR